MARLFVCVLWMLLSSAAGTSARAEDGANPDGFDLPLDKRIVPARPDPLNPGKATLTCFRYPGFMVKQTDRGEKGASRLAIVPLADRANHVACREAAMPHEVVLGGDRGWSGYFRGAKGRYVFFDGDDGFEGGMAFAVFDATSGRRLFVDAIRDTFKNIVASPSGLRLSYRRIYRTGCSLYPAAPACWSEVKTSTGLNDAARSGCRAAYQKALSLELVARSGAVSPTQISKQTLDDPSVLAYDVHVSVGTGAASIGADRGTVDCFPAE